jgi:PPK2 family polyphosphate:nucleotide phosphotransferase
MIESPYRVMPGTKIDLSEWKTADTGKFKDKSAAKPLVEKNLVKLIHLQDKFYADNRFALLIVLQAMDAGGKDGAIRHVFSGVNPQGCQVTSFKVPTQEELSHDYLWRYHHACPRRGLIGIFNRSHYESVLVERVHKLVPKSVWSKRYEQLNQFEETLTDANTVILKFFLHISKGEQKRRLEARLKDESKNWKLQPSDVKERRYWDDYTKAWEELLCKCSTDDAPWFVVPSDHKWFRNWVLSDTIVRTLAKLKLRYPPASKELKHLKIK